MAKTTKNMLVKTAQTKAITAPKSNLLEAFDPTDLTAVPVIGYDAFINPDTKTGSVRLHLQSGPVSLRPMTDATVAAVVSILATGSAFWDGVNVITSH
jgi:hypothetical protein